MALRRRVAPAAAPRPLACIAASRLAQLLALAAMLLAARPAAAAAHEFAITLDARQAPRGLLQAQLTFSVDPGPFTLYYPKWIPGEHSPTGPVRDLVDLRLRAGAHELDWQRDPRDLYVFRTTIPRGEKTLRVDLSFLLPTEPRGFSAGRSATANLAVLSWHYVMLYPAGRPAAQLTVRPRLLVPEGWRYATALRPQGAAEDGAIGFRPVPLTTLIDSPVLTGRHFRQFQLAASPVPVELHIAADKDSSLEHAAEASTLYARLVEQALALFGSAPFERYDFLMALSDHIALFGLEHYESSDNRLGERMLLTDGGRRGAAGMLAHELVHVWNGKIRRPADMALENFQQPQSTELLWVYEGLTNYLESLIPVRAGLWGEQDWRDSLAITAAELQAQSGRRWRTLADVSMSAQLQFEAPASGADRRRKIDFYDESDLLWLEVDVTIRQLTGGQKSLDDFCRQFLGRPSRHVRTPDVAAYTYRDLLAALHAVARHDWEEFFRQRVYRPAQAPVGGIEKGGWRLEFAPDLPPRFRLAEETSGRADFRHSLGLVLKRETDGRGYRVEDVLAGSPAHQAGVFPGMVLSEVNGGAVTPDRMREAIREAQDDPGTIRLRVRHDGEDHSITLRYGGGPRYPHLERDAGKPDLLGEIARPLSIR